MYDAIRAYYAGPRSPLKGILRAVDSGDCKSLDVIDALIDLEMAVKSGNLGTILDCEDELIACFAVWIDSQLD